MNLPTFIPLNPYDVLTPEIERNRSSLSKLEIERNSLQIEINNLDKQTTALENRFISIFNNPDPALLEQAKNEILEGKVILGREKVEYFTGMYHDSDIGRNGMDFPTSAIECAEQSISFSLLNGLPTSQEIVDFSNSNAAFELETKT
jgi:hypothetical protein